MLQILHFVYVDRIRDSVSDPSLRLCRPDPGFCFRSFTSFRMTIHCPSEHRYTVIPNASTLSFRTQVHCHSERKYIVILSASEESGKVKNIKLIKNRQTSSSATQFHQNSLSRKNHSTGTDTPFLSISLPASSTFAGTYSPISFFLSRWLHFTLSSGAAPGPSEPYSA